LQKETVKENIKKPISSFDKVYFIDTNIILDNHQNVITLAQGGNNLIVIPETVMNELDSKKSGFDTINFEARAFNRMLSEADADQGIDEIGNYAKRVYIQLGDVYIHLVSLNKYETDKETTSGSIYNDRLIIETAKRLETEYPDVILLSNDIAFRSSALLNHLKCQPFLKNDIAGYSLSFDANITCDVDIEETCLLDEEMKLLYKNCTGNDLERHVCSMMISNDTSGRKYFFVKASTIWQTIDEKELMKQDAKPRNVEQKVLSTLMMDESQDIIVIEGPAGTGKNYITLSGATYLYKKYKAKYHKIIYIRKTIISGDKSDELGFLPGDLMDKMAGYLAPMENTIENIVTSKSSKKLTKDEIAEAMEKFKKDYNIEYGYVGHLRGSTFSKGSIVILDEAQNFTAADIRTIISRVGEDSRVIVAGSLRQIDNPYLNKHNNGLAFMMSKCGENNPSDVRIAGVNLRNVIRSKIAEWADEVFDR
jgi:PhoH-like ATPase